MEELLKTKIFKVTVERLLLNGGQTLYMVGWSLLIGTIIGMILALILVLCRKGGLVENRPLYNLQRLHQRGAQYPLCYSSCNDHADHPRYCRNDHRKYGSVGAVSSLYKSVPCEADGEQPA